VVIVPTKEGIVIPLPSNGFLLEVKIEQIGEISKMRRNVARESNARKVEV